MRSSPPCPGSTPIRAELPVGAVVELAERSDVTAIRPADEATTNRAGSSGIGANEADVTHAADTARDRYGVDGTGVKVCVLSDGVASLAERQATGDLPPVDVLPGQAGPASGDEGTAMLELIHDVAPGAELGFATAFTSQASFAQNILNLRTDGCKVMVDDVTWYAETTLQDANIAQAIRTVRAAGVTYFSSAGNSGNLPDGTSGTWQGDFQDGGAAAAPLPTTADRPPLGPGRGDIQRPHQGRRAAEPPVGGSRGRLGQRLRPLRAQQRGHRGGGLVHQRAERHAEPGGVDRHHARGRRPRRGDQEGRGRRPVPGAVHERRGAWRPAPAALHGGTT